MTRKDPLTRWIEMNCGTSSPVEVECEARVNVEQKREKDYSDTMKEFHNSFVGE
jgi:hypothetical protein